MAGFLKPLVVTPLPDGRYWVTDRELEYCIGSPYSYQIVIVRTGFKTDFASVPRALWGIFPPFGKYTAAAVVHDWLYQHPFYWQTFIDADASQTIMSRSECDRVFREAMQVLNVGWWTRNTMWAGVRTGGWAPWNAYRKQEQTR